MTINPADLPDGTVVEYRNLSGHYFDRLDRAGDRTFMTIVRTFSPDPTPDQEVPREEWASIKPGSRVRIVETNGDEHTVTAEHPSTSSIDNDRYSYWLSNIAHVYLLDEPADPDADLIERMAADLRDRFGSEAPHWMDEPETATPEISDAWRAEARAVLAVVREADQ